MQDKQHSGGRLLAAVVVILIVLGFISYNQHQTTESARVSTPQIYPDEGNPALHRKPDPLIGLRNLVARELQKNFLRAGYDVQVSLIVEDSSRMVIYGKPVNRPFAYNMRRSRQIMKLLRSAKFSEVEFMDSMTFPDFVQKYSVN
jgi:hypothetical protein